MPKFTPRALVANSNYVEVFTKLGENLGGRPSIDYHLTLDMDKELSMDESSLSWPSIAHVALIFRAAMPAS